MKFKITESIIDPERESLTHVIWDRDDNLKPEVKEKILLLIPNDFNVDKVLITGSITTKFWTKDADIDVTVLSPVDDEMLRAYRDYAIQVNETEYIEKHPINLFFRNETLEEIGTDFTDGIYSVNEDEWIKHPVDIDNVYQFLKEPRKLAEKISKKLDVELDEVEQDVNDIINMLTNNKKWKWQLSTFSGFDKDYDLGVVEDKLTELEIDIQNYNESISTIKKRRLEEYSRALTEEDQEIIEKYKTKNLLPFAIIYKYLQKWSYYKFYYLFKRVLKDEEIDIEDIKKIWKTFVNFAQDD